MELSNMQHKQLHRALNSAFPTQTLLDRFLRQALDINFDVFARTEDYQAKVLQLIQSLESQGQLDDLLQAAIRVNPKNPALQSLIEQLSGSRASPGARLTLRRTQRTRRGYIEPLLTVPSDALPLHMVLVPGGTFTMGSPDDEPKRRKNEEPPHEVTVLSFFMGRYPVTQAQWRVVAAMPQIKHELKADPSDFKGNNRPVENVSWHDAVEFCDRISAHTNRPYRLPTEAEWEYACRAGTTTPFYFGKTLTDELANYNASVTYNDGPEGKERKETTPVDHFGIANAFGLSDMHGNVFEWCQDQYHSNYDGAPTDGSAWEDGGENAARILRGGSWFNSPGICRSAFRFNVIPDVRDGTFGFRVVCSAPRALQ